jgi:hypothetical protein
VGSIPIARSKLSNDPKLARFFLYTLISQLIATSVSSREPFGQFHRLLFPYPGLAKAIGVMMKLDFERAVLNRVPQMEAHPEQQFRQVFFICDEYQHIATVGENEPTGDEKFFSLSRQPKCIPIIATQSISSLKSALPGESWVFVFSMWFDSEKPDKITRGACNGDKVIFENPLNCTSTGARLCMKAVT